MDRNINYAGQVPLETDLLKTNQFTMTALAKLSAAMFGSGGTAVGFATTQTVVPSMAVLVAPGEIYQLQNLEATAFSSMAADTAHSVVKQGISLDARTIAVAAPGTAGFSINYLIQASYQDSDTGSTVLPYYNASNPSVAYSGPANSGTAQPTTRAGAVVITAKAGTAATTGTQTTPAPDAGYVGLYVVTVANGASSVTNANIAQYASAPILPVDLLHAFQNSALVVGVDSGAANACVVSFSPAITTLVDGMVLWFKANATNTGAATLNVNGLGASPILGGAHAALQGGEIVSAGKCQVVWNATLSSWVLIECTGAAIQVASASKTQHAIALAQSLTGATVQNVTASRAIGTTYTNSTARPIHVNVSAISSTTSSAAINATVAGVTMVGSSVISATALSSVLSFVVPPGANYVVNISAGTFSGLNNWTEVR